MKPDEELPAIGKDEMNLVEFPITLLAKRHDPKIKTLEFSDTIEGENGKPVKRVWTVTGSDKFGLPLAQDNDFLLGIMAIAKESNFSSPTIYFSRYRLLEIMGLDTKAGSNYNRAEDSLDRLSGVRIKAVNGFWDNERKSYVTVNFGIIDSYALYDSHKPAGQPGLPFNSVDLNKYFYQSILAGYIKSLDLSKYYGLESALAKRLYRYLDKKAYRKKKFEIGLFALAGVHLGLKLCKYASQIKQQLNPAHAELINAGFLKGAEYQKTSDGKSEKVIYYFGSHRAELTEGAPAGPVKGLNNAYTLPLDAELLARLIEIGVTRKIAEQILLEYPLEAVRAQVEALPHRKAEDAPAALVSSIMNDWSLPASLKKRKQSLARAEAEKQQKELEKQQKEEHRTRLQEYLSALAGEELAELTRQARDLAGQEYGALFPGREIPEYQVTGYLHILAEERLKRGRNERGK